MRKIWALVTLTGMVTGAPAQTPPPHDLSGLQSVADQVRRFGPWERQYAFFERAIARIWSNNGWRDESDDFAYQTFRDVARIPPWEVMARLDTLARSVQRRYALTDQQAGELKGLIAREAGALFIKHGAVIARQVNEQLNMRVDGLDDEALMAALRADVARWTRETDGLHADALAAVERVMDRFASGLNADQRKQFDIDRKTVGKLMAFASHVREEASAGRFKPELLGMDAAELATFVRQPRVMSDTEDMKKAVVGGGSPPLPMFVRTDPSTWYIYVRQFGERYRLDSAQLEAAESIRIEMVERAENYLAPRRAEVDAIEPRGRDDHPLLRPVVDLFENMKARLEALPRREQREAAGDRKPVLPGGG